MNVSDTRAVTGGSERGGGGGVWGAEAVGCFGCQNSHWKVEPAAELFLVPACHLGHSAIGSSLLYLFFMEAEP